MLAIEDARYGAALERNGIVVEQRVRVRGLRATLRHSECDRPGSARKTGKGDQLYTAHV